MISSSGLGSILRFILLKPKEKIKFQFVSDSSVVGEHSMSVVESTVTCESVKHDSSVNPLNLLVLSSAHVRLKLLLRYICGIPETFIQQESLE
jgi:hypothetical protein